MSKLSGILYFDSRPLNGKDVNRVEEALGEPGYTNARLARPEMGLVMGWARGCEPARGEGLASGPDGSCCSWDGRVDNRKEEAAGRGEGDGGDSALVLIVYRRRGVEGLREVVGDWSLCLWDAGRRTMVLASDYAGIRPLYYHRGREFLCWSSSLRDVVRWTGITELDEMYVASFLTRGSAVERTPYAGIRSVPPGQAVCVARDRLEKRAFWRVAPDGEIRYPDERSYEEQLLGLFREACQARIGGTHPPAPS